MQLTKLIPTKTQTFLFAMWVWAWILFKLTLLANFMLKLVITHLPNYILPATDKTPVKIIKAIDGNGDDITNKLKLFMNLKWDETMFDDHGGIDLDTFFGYIDSAVVWVAYIFDYDIDDIASLEFINGVKPVDYFKKCIRFIIVDSGKKIMRKFNKDTTDFVEEDIMFGEVDFE
jgi:hypothetical protein